MFKICILGLTILVLLQTNQASSASCPGDQWTQWFDRDNPSATGDWETLGELRKENPGKICDCPTAIDVQTLSGVDYTSANEIVTVSEKTGFHCKNELQSDGYCNDYKVRFCCQTCYWTQWFDRDNPSGYADYENLYWLRKENPGKICEHPEAVEGKVLNHAGVKGYNNLVMTPESGLNCDNRKQPEGIRCKDYAVRFYCCE